MNIFLKNILLGCLCLQTIHASSTDCIEQKIDKADDIARYMKKFDIPNETLVCLDLDQTTFDARSGDAVNASEKRYFDEDILVDGALLPRRITEAETDATCREGVKELFAELKVKAYVMAVTARPPAMDVTIAEWASAQPQGSEFHNKYYLHMKGSVREPIKNEYLNSLNADKLIELATLKVAAMEETSGLTFSNQPALQQRLADEESKTAFVNGVAYVGYDKGLNFLNYFKKLKLNDIKHIVVVDDDERSISSYRKKIIEFKRLGITLHLLHWPVPKEPSE